MLDVARRRLKAKNKKVKPAKPKPPPASHWDVYPRSYVIDFFWDWHNSDYDQKLTPDGRPWQDQDELFWELVEYIRQLFKWAEYVAEHPTRKPLNAKTMEQL